MIEASCLRQLLSAGRENGTVLRRRFASELVPAVPILSIAVSAMLAPPASLAQQMYAGGFEARPLITAPIDNSKLVVLRGNTLPAANQKNDRGPAPDDMPLKYLQLVLERPPELEKELESLIDEMNRKGSPVYHKWLTAREFGERFGLAPADIVKLTEWLKSYGFEVGGILPSGMAIEFSGTAGEIRQAFHTGIHRLDVKGERHYANMSDPEIPAALALAVKGVVALHDFKARPMFVKRKDMASRGMFTFTSDGSPNYFFAPPDMATIYNLNPVFSSGITGAGQTIAVVEDSDLANLSDVTTFRSAFGLSGYKGTVTQEQPQAAKPSENMTCNDPGENGAEGEVALDAEWSGAAAPNADIVIATCADAGGVYGFLTAAENLVNGATPPDMISMSYGVCDNTVGSAGHALYESTFQQAAGMGIGVFVSSGDSGAAMCDASSAPYAEGGISPNGFADTSYNVAVGGTDFADAYESQIGGPPQTNYWSSTNTSALGSAISYIPEIPWNDSCAGGLVDSLFGYAQAYGTTGACNASSSIGYSELQEILAGSGGASTLESQPIWQTGVYGLPTSSGGPRYLPDVSLFSSTGDIWGHALVYCMSDTNQGGAACDYSDETDVFDLLAGGTSFAAPMMAGIQALVNQAAGADQGNPGPRYYALGALEFGASGSAACNSSTVNVNQNSCVFYDITLGDNIVPCMETDCYGTDNKTYVGALSTSTSSFEPAYTAGTGWDYATGLGSVNVYNLIQNWSEIETTTSVSAKSPADLNTSVTFTATVAPSLGSARVSGTVNWSSNTGCSPSELSAGQTTCTTSALPAGSNTVTATYEGTGPANGGTDFAGSSGSFAEVINAQMALSPATLPGATAGANYDVQLAATGGTPSYIFQATGLPTGLTLNSSNAITGQCTAGSANVMLSVTDSAGSFVKVGPLTVSCNPAPTIATTSLPAATASMLYSTAIAASGGTAPVSYSLSPAVSGFSIDPGSGILSGKASSFGTVPIDVVVTDMWGATGRQQFSLTVLPAAATIKLASSAKLVTFGAPVTLSATVTGNGAVPTGTVTFKYGATNLGTSPLNAGGAAMLKTTSLPPGADSVTATYPGNNVYASAEAGPLVIMVAKASQTIFGLDLPTSVTYGAKPLNLSGRATSGLPVAFTVAGPARIDGDTLTLAGAGTAIVTARQPGNEDYEPAPDVSVRIKVNQATPAIEVKSSASKLELGKPVTFTATLSGAGATPTGEVSFYSGKTKLGAMMLNRLGKAEFTTDKLSVGKHEITAVYEGNGDYREISSPEVSVIVTE